MHIYRREGLTGPLTSDPTQFWIEFTPRADFPGLADRVTFIQITLNYICPVCNSRAYFRAV